MSKRTVISKTLWVFSGLSRKSYAAFMSLGRLIKIGRLSADICNKSLFKLACKYGSTLSPTFGTDTGEDEPLLFQTAFDDLPEVPGGCFIFGIIQKVTIPQTLFVDCFRTNQIIRRFNKVRYLHCA